MSAGRRGKQGSRLAAIAVGSWLVLGLSPAVRAESINVASVTISNVPSPYTWSYSMSLSAGSSVQTGDYFALLDWVGFILGSASQPSADWQFSYSNTLSSCPPGLDTSCAADDPSIGNLVWRYEGTQTIFGGSTGISLGVFSAQSSSEQPTAGVLIAQDHGFFGPSGNNQTIPVPLGTTTVPVSEPATGLLLGTAFVALLARTRNRRDRASAPA